MFVLVLCVSVLSVCTSAKADDVSLDFTGAMNQLDTALFAENKNVASIKSMIQSYCSVVLHSSWFHIDDFNYSARQSTFVYFLCKNVWRYAPSKPLPLFADDKTFKLTDWNALDLQDIHFQTVAATSASKTDFCASSTTMNQCNVSKQVPKLFNMIINDYINLKQPSLYGFTAGLGDNADANIKAANIFSSGYFNGLQICKKSDRDYTATCKSLTKYIQDTKKIFADVQIFDYKKIITPTVDKDVCTVSNANYNLLLCWLYGDKDFSLERFLNLTYNEMFYYRLFAQYYAWMLTTKEPNILWLSQNELAWESFARIRQMNNELLWSQDALSVSMRMLRDSYTAFPLHIGFLMYQEDLLHISTPLGALYTPLSQLYYTLQHVQKKE